MENNEQQEITFADVKNDYSEREFETRHYPREYIQQCFIVWYNGGKPPVKQLYLHIPISEFAGKKPNIYTLNKWIAGVFVPQAKSLDEEVMKKLNEKLISEKMEMLQRHADTGKEIQEIAFDYIKQHKDELTINSAARLWEAGVEIERNSRGIPDALKKLQQMSDEDILKDIKQIIDGGSAELLPEGEVAEIIDTEAKDVVD